MPTIIIYLNAPEAFSWGVLRYGATAPFVWYHMNGFDHMLGPVFTAESAWSFLNRSPALPALIVVLVLMMWRRNAGPTSEIVFLDTLVFAGFVAAVLPTPSWPYYYLTLLLPLFVRLGPTIDQLRRAPSFTKFGLIAVFGVFLAFTFDWRFRDILKMSATAPSAASKVEAEAHWIGKQLRVMGAKGSIATLSPFIVVDSGYPLDPRFATGVFVYRTGKLLTPELHSRFHTVGPQTLVGALDAAKPAAIVVGYETHNRRFKINDLDGQLRAYARTNGYRLRRSPLGDAELFVAPLTGVSTSPRLARSKS